MAGRMFALSSTGEVLAGLARAAHVEVTAYTLRGDVLYALEAAARRGARVEVELESRPYNDPHGHLAAENRSIVERLRNAGAEARLADPVHAKEIAADGTLYFDDKNWASTIWSCEPAIRPTADRLLRRRTPRSMKKRAFYEMPADTMASSWQPSRLGVATRFIRRSKHWRAKA